MEYRYAIQSLNEWQFNNPSRRIEDVHCFEDLALFQAYLRVHLHDLLFENNFVPETLKAMLAQSSHPNPVESPYMKVTCFNDFNYKTQTLATGLPTSHSEAGYELYECTLDQIRNKLECILSQPLLYEIIQRIKNTNIARRIRLTINPPTNWPTISILDGIRERTEDGTLKLPDKVRLVHSKFDPELAGDEPDETIHLRTDQYLDDEAYVRIRVLMHLAKIEKKPGYKLFIRVNKATDYAQDHMPMVERRIEMWIREEKADRKKS